MGLISFFITLAIMILGVGYFLFGSSNGSVTVEKTNVSEQGTMSKEQGATSLASFEAIKDQADSVSKQVTENSKQLAESIEQLTDSNKQKATQTADAPPAGGTTVVLNEKTGINIIEKKVNFGFGVSGQERTIDTVVLHSSYNSLGGDVYSVDRVIAIWKGYEVAPHYMIDRKGNVYRLVDDANIAYHAGVSKMPDGRTNVNDFSIGVEILNTKDEKYTDVQYLAVNDLIVYLKGKYSIKTVVGHADIAPGRKTDPWNFDWKKVN